MKAAAALSAFLLVSITRGSAEERFVRGLPDPPKKVAGILVLDNCDSEYQGKAEYTDNFTLFDPAGKVVFRASGFNNCESIGSSQMITADVSRGCIWVIENVAHRIRRFDLAGKETLVIHGVHGSAIAVDNVSGYVWALENEGQIGNGRTVVYDGRGKEVASHAISGWDIVHDPTGKAFWIAGEKLTKIIAETGEVVFSVPVSPWTASSVDIDPNSGAAWVAVRRHPDVRGSWDGLLKFDADGKQLATVTFPEGKPFKVSVDPKNGSVWVANFKHSIQRFSSEGKPELDLPIQAITVEADAAGGKAWAVTTTDVQQFDENGIRAAQANHAAATSQAWITSLR